MKTNQPLWNRLSLVTGIVFAVLYSIASLLLGQLGYAPDAETVIAFFGSDPMRISIAGYLGVLSAFFLLWFAGSLDSELGRASDGPWARIASGGGVAAAVFVALAFLGERALGARAATDAGIGPEAAIVLIDLSDQITNLALPVAMAALIGATGAAVLRSKTLPDWFGWLSLILAVGLLSPVLYLIAPLALLWTIGLSLWLFIRSRPNPSPTA